MRRLLVAVALVVAPFAVGGRVDAASGCHVSTWNAGAVGGCSTGGYVMKVRCKHVSNGSTWWTNGPYRTNGSPSEASCGYTGRRISHVLAIAW